VKKQGHVAEAGVPAKANFKLQLPQLEVQVEAFNLPVVRRRDLKFCRAFFSLYIFYFSLPNDEQF
jgi:hypothetical protein